MQHQSRFFYSELSLCATLILVSICAPAFPSSVLNLAAPSCSFDVLGPVNFSWTERPTPPSPQPPYSGPADLVCRVRVTKVQLTTMILPQGETKPIA